jgi:hypothetical protein
MNTALFHRRCRGCGRRIRVRLEVAKAPFQTDRMLAFVCDACLAAKVEAVVAERETAAVRTCPHGHLMTEANSARYTHPETGYTQVQCKACRQTRHQTLAAARKAERQARQGGGGSS